MAVALGEVLAARLAKLPTARGIISDRHSLDKLGDYFATKSDDGVEIIRLGPVVDWIIYSAREWNNALKDVNKPVKIFILRLITISSEKEDLFLNLKHNQVYENILTSCSLNQNDPSLKFGLLKIILSISHHKAGIEFLLENNYWEEVIKYCHTNQTIYFSRIGINFITLFVWKLSDLNLEKECNEVISNLLTSLLNHPWKNNTVMSDEEDSLMDSALSPTLNILIKILENVERFGKSNILVKTINSHNLEWHLWNLFQLCRRSVLLGTISKLLLLVRFCKIYGDKESEDKIMQSDVVEFCLTHANLMSALISKRDPQSILEVTNFCYIYISKVSEYHKLSMIIEKDEQSYDFVNQIIIMSLLPTLCSCKNKKNEFLELYAEKLQSLACEYTTRIAYAFRDLVKENNDLNIPIKAIQHSISLKKYLNKTQAIIIFQSFYYKLQDFVPENDDENNYIVIGTEKRESSLLVSTLLDAIYIFIEEFDIPWQDTLEVLCVCNFCIRVIKTNNIDIKLTVQAFKLAQLTIKKFLSPNLALLVNNAHGSVIEEISKNIYEKLHDPSWEIRDSAMELLFVVSDIAEFKFPAFQQQISENNLPELVVILAVEDSELYVRASALRCIAFMVRIQLLWEKHFQRLDLMNKIIYLLHNESEGLVRREAACVMVNIYEYQKFPSASLDNVFLTMFHAATEDLHWEVQIRALQFWKKVIANQMSHQGMIDGIFPSVTFSKENRKIVHLNETEIKRRLKKILNELAIRGCLGVLLICVKDDSDVEVMEKALSIIDEIKQLLNKYNVNEINSIDEISNSVKRPFFDECFLKHKTDSTIGNCRNKADIRNETNHPDSNGECQNSDNIIESIVNSDDVNLLANVYANQLKVNNDENAKSDELKIKSDITNISNMFVEPEIFIKTIRETDFRKILDNKKKWTFNISCDINSLFDDILGSYNLESDVNSMDCY